MAEGTIDFQYGARGISLTLRDGCSVSRFIEEHGGFYEAPFLEHLTDVIPRGACVVDVGAHIGNHTVFFAAVLGLRVVAIEPDPISYAALRENIVRNGVEEQVLALNLAVADRTGTGTMSLQVGSDAGTNSLTQDLEPDPSHIEVATLDGLHAERFRPFLADDEPVGFLKIDIEGREPDALRGAGRLIAEHRPIISTEVQSESAVTEIERLLVPAGYRVVGVFNPTPTLLWWPSGSRVVAPDLPASIRSANVAYALRSSLELTRMRTERAMVASPSDPIDEGADRPAPCRSGTRRGVVLITGRSVGLDMEQLSHRFARTIEVRLTEDDERRRVAIVEWEQGREVGAWTEDLSLSSDRLVVLRLLEIFEETGVPRLLICDYSEATVGISRSVTAALELPYVLSFGGDAEVWRRDWPFVLGARSRLLLGLDEQAWSSQVIMGATSCSLDDHESILAELDRSYVEPVEASGFGMDADSAQLRVLLLSYYMPPCESVAVNRLAYWHEELPKIAAERGVTVTVDVITASGSHENDDRCAVVVDRGLDHPHGRRHLALVRVLADLGLESVSSTWPSYVEDHLSGSQRTYDVVVMSGNPFYYFDLVYYFRDEHDAAVILDFRDPFAKNPRIGYSQEQRDFLLAMEDRFVTAADAVISVNDTSLGLIGSEPPKRAESVPNGYNEQKLDDVLTSATSPAGERTTFVYAGSFAHDRDPLPFVSVLDAAKQRFVHVGRSGPETEELVRSSAAEWVGHTSYEAALRIIAGADAGMIFTSGTPFEHTTKVFDYIGADIDIIIVTDGEPRTGELHRLTEGLEGVYWVRNTADELSRFLERYRPQRRQRPRRDEYSRKAQAERLMNLILELRPVAS